MDNAAQFSVFPKCLYYIMFFKRMMDNHAYSLRTCQYNECLTFHTHPDLVQAGMCSLQTCKPACSSKHLSLK